METERPARINFYGDLKVYQLSYQLALEIHRMTSKFPALERGELASQLRRAATSVPINLGGGYGREKSADDFKPFLGSSMGSCHEIELILASRPTPGELSNA